MERPVPPVAPKRAMDSDDAELVGKAVILEGDVVVC
jgi:hypothetical protein